MRARIGLLIIPPLLLMGIMLVGTQFLFLRAGFHEDLGLGRSAPELTLANYAEVWHDPTYLESLVRTLWLSLLVVVLSVLAAWPAAYALSRMRPAIALALLALVVASSFVTLPIKILGLVILFAADGPLMRFLTDFGLVAPGFSFIGSLTGVIVGYAHLSIGFLITTLFSILQAVPHRYEEAAAILGANRWRVLWRVVIPLSVPGTIGASLILFNLLAGAFVSAALLGGGKIVTLPILIQRTLLLFNDYGIAAALSALLLAVVLAVNIAAVWLTGRLGHQAGVIA